MTDKPKAKLIRVEPNKIWYFTSYYFECVDCGSEYHRHRNDKRISPYCGMCQRKHDTERARERRNERESMRKDEFPIVHEYCRQETIKELEKIKAEIQILSFFSKPYNMQMVEMSNVVERIDNHISELKGENK